MKTEFSFSIWLLEGEKTSWKCSPTSGSNARDALSREIGRGKTTYPDGFYFVCDPKYNPDSGQYGRTIFWVENGVVFDVERIIVKSSQNKLRDETKNVEVIVV